MSDSTAPEDAPSDAPSDASGDDLEKPSILQEFVYFLKYEKKWWMGFIVVVLGLLFAFILLTENQATMPFIYTIF